MLRNGTTVDYIKVVIRMKKRSLLRYMVPMLCLLMVAAAWFGAKQVSAAVQKLQKIEAEYYGEPVEVGKSINIKDIFVVAEYLIQDGRNGYTDYVDVKKGFTISPSVIERRGNNRVVVTYQNKSCIITVEGKVVESINAEYIGDELFVGSAVSPGKIEVFADFSDGSYERVKDFTISEATITKEGVNLIPVTYKGKTDYVEVYGKAPLEIEELYAYYKGEGVIVGNPVSKNEIVVEAIYNDGTYKPVTNFSISPSVIEREGSNEIVVSYGNVETTVEVYGEERYVTDMQVKYTGGGVIVGQKINRDEIEVIATYNDGSDEEIENYDLLGEEILYDGENLVFVYFESFVGEIVVLGVKGFAANYDNPISGYFTSPECDYSTEVTLGMNMEVGKDKFFLRAADNEMVDYVVQRVVPTDEFVGFELFYDDDEMDIEFPMAMKVTVPEGFEPENFSVYYTPNQSTIMAKVVGDFMDEEQTEYEFVVYQPGAYILVHEVSKRLVTDIIVETEIKLRENRSYSLNPVVFPLTAENREVTYSSSDEDVATVSENGKIRTRSEGVCEILIETQDESGVYVIVTVEVKNGK